MLTRHLNALISRLLICAGALLWSGDLAAQSADQIIARSLVKLKIAATDNMFQRQEASGTGFIITTGGQVLTTWHTLSRLGELHPDPDIRQLRISASVGQIDIEPGDVAIIDQNEKLDLLLLKLPLRFAPYTPVTLGQSASVEKNTDIATSGFPLDADSPIPDDDKLRTKEGPGGSVWTTRMEFLDGQSGSPVYILNEDESDPQVIGIVKGRHKNGALSYFTPIDFADPLIVAVRMQTLSKQINDVECRICLNATGNLCQPNEESICSGWANPKAPESAWSSDFKVFDDGTGFKECKIRFRTECR